MHNKSTRLPPLPGRPPPAYDERGPAPILARPLFRTAVHRSEVLDRHSTMVEFTRCKRHPHHRVSGLDSDDVPKKCTNKNPPGYHRYPVVRRPPTTNAVLPRLALRALRTRVPGLGVSQPNGRLGTRRRLAPSETTVYYAESTDRQPPDTHVSEGTPAVIPDDRDFVIELTIHLCNLNCTPYWILACSSVT